MRYSLRLFHVGVCYFVGERNNTKVTSGKGGGGGRGKKVGRSKEGRLFYYLEPVQAVYVFRYKSKCTVYLAFHRLD